MEREEGQKTMLFAVVENQFGSILYVQYVYGRLHIAQNAMTDIACIFFFHG